jgi:hypothetical protein
MGDGLNDSSVGPRLFNTFTQIYSTIIKDFNLCNIEVHIKIRSETLNEKCAIFILYLHCCSNKCTYMRMCFQYRCPLLNETQTVVTYFLVDK